MNLYAESSAVLAWLLGEDVGPRVRRALAAADVVFASRPDSDRMRPVLIRAVSLRALSEAQGSDLHAHLQNAASQWHVLRVGPEVVSRARQPFPAEPIRTLDARHLASAITARAAVPDLAVLSLDERIRRAVLGIGFTVRPE